MNLDELGENMEARKAKMRANKDLMADVCGNPRCGMPVKAGSGHCPCKQDMHYCSKQCQKMDRPRHAKKCTVPSKKKKQQQSTQDHDKAPSDEDVCARCKKEAPLYMQSSLDKHAMCGSCVAEVINDQMKGTTEDLRAMDSCSKCNAVLDPRDPQYRIRLKEGIFAACQECTDAWKKDMCFTKQEWLQQKSSSKEKDLLR